MRGTLLKVFSLVLVLGAVGVVAFAARAGGGTTDEAALKEIAGYKSWTRVTEKPIPGGNIFAGG